MINDYFEFSLIFVSMVIIIYITFFLNRVDIYDDPKVLEIKLKLLPIDPRIKNIPFYASNKSFTENKKRIYMCLKDQNGNYYDDNMLIYVALHELAHAFSSNIDPDHTSPEFNDNFSKLKNDAIELGIWDPSQPIVMGYCKHE
jgi:hypothetical protein